MMKRTYLFILWATALLLTAACANDSDMMADIKNLEERSGAEGIYDGEWTVNKQVVDTARMEVFDKLKLRLPEEYLTRLCFPDKSGADSPQSKGIPMEVKLLTQGYSEQMELYNFFYEMFHLKDGEQVYSIGYYYVTIAGVDYRINLRGNDYGNAIFRLDTSLWTAGLSIKSFMVSEINKNVWREQPLATPVTIYYNAKQRIR